MITMNFIYYSGLTRILSEVEIVSVWKRPESTILQLSAKKPINFKFVHISPSFVDMTGRYFDICNTGFKESIG